MMMIVLILLCVLQLIYGHRDEMFGESSSNRSAPAAFNHRISLQDTVYYYYTGAAQYLTIPSTGGRLMSMSDYSFRHGD
jgi:hypothetical protein